MPIQQRSLDLTGAGIEDGCVVLVAVLAFSIGPARSTARLAAGRGELDPDEPGRGDPGSDDVGGDQGPDGRIPQQDDVGLGQSQQRGQRRWAGREGVFFPSAVTIITSNRPSPPSGPAVQLTSGP